MSNSTDNNGGNPVEQVVRPKTGGGTNNILKGSKLIGDINVTCDLELSGEIEGNITSEHNSNIVIKGTCKGNIQTREGNVDIVGELHDGNIIAGSDVKISGKFIGGEITAKGRIYVNGEFDGKLEGNEIEIGPNARGKGELLYKELISIDKGAHIEGHICKIPAELKLVEKSTDAQKAEVKPPTQKASAAK